MTITLPYSPLHSLGLALGDELGVLPVVGSGDLLRVAREGRLGSENVGTSVDVVDSTEEDVHLFELDTLGLRKAVESVDGQRPDSNERSVRTARTRTGRRGRGRR